MVTFISYGINADKTAAAKLLAERLGRAYTAIGGQPDEVGGADILDNPNSIPEETAYKIRQPIETADERL